MLRKQKFYKQKEQKGWYLQSSHFCLEQNLTWETFIITGFHCISLFMNTPQIFHFFRGGFNMPSLRPVSMGPGVVFHPLDSSRSEGAYDLASPQSGRDSNVSLKSELSDLDSPDKQSKDASSTSDKEQLTDAIDVTEKSTGTSELGGFPGGFCSLKFEVARSWWCSVQGQHFRSCCIACCVRISLCKDLLDVVKFRCVMICWLYSFRRMECNFTNWYTQPNKNCMWPPARWCLCMSQNEKWCRTKQKKGHPSSLLSQTNLLPLLLCGYRHRHKYTQRNSTNTHAHVHAHNTHTHTHTHTHSHTHSLTAQVQTHKRISRV